MSQPLESSESTARQTILSWRREHAGLEKHVTDLTAAMSARNAAASAQHFDAFRTLLLEHLREEEETIFPLAERSMRIDTNPIRSLRIAHGCYREDLMQIAAHIEAGHLDAAALLLGSFVESFAAHERLEDQVLELVGHDD